ncbi:cytochrome P450 [Haloechinothrix salitolerans]|uniref:Cytochrome P450 n=1 Tax=Haloechinothrix salitolerans TaxID=926830 RepID=A0ABW2BW78_9PSEU
MTNTLREPVMADGRLPLLGHGLRMKRAPGDFLLSLQNGDAVSMIQLGRETAYVLNDPELIRQALRDTETFIRGGPVTERFRAMFGNGLGISEGEFHRRQRAIIQPAFHRNKIIEYAGISSEIADDYTKRWRDGERVAVDEEMDSLALANVIRVMFSADTGIDQTRFMSAVSTVLGGLFQRVADSTGLITALPTPANRRYRRSEEYLRRTIHDVISAYRAADVDHGDLLSMMMFARDESGEPAMSDQQLHDEVMTFFIAGSNTISNTLAWACHEIATHPDVERAMHAEVDEVLGGRPAAHDDLANLTYTRRVITETLRYRTQGLFLSRVTALDTEIGGYAIPEGATVLYSFHALNHNPAIHPRPGQFDPDRWEPERAKSIPRGAFMPFSIGTHGCIGDQLAWTEMVITLATIATRWRLTSVPGHVPQPKLAITMPVDSLPMIAHRRVS